MPKIFFENVSKLFSRVAIATLFLAPFINVRAAEISLAESGSLNRPLDGILIEGPIVKGDYKRFQLLAFSGVSTVWLASPGGDLAEAIKIGQLVRKLKMDVWAPDSNRQFWNTMIRVSDQRNSVCASACFFIYAAGTYRAGNILGVHRPRFADDDLRAMTMEQAATGHVSANDAAALYLRKMGISSSIIEKAVTTKPSDI